jgi:hypothetical protein
VRKIGNNNEIAIENFLGAGKIRPKPSFQANNRSLLNNNKSDEALVLKRPSEDV